MGAIAVNSSLDKPPSRQKMLIALLLVAMAVAATGLWVERQSTPGLQAEALPPELRDEPDLFINDAVIHQFRTDGKRKYLLRAETVRHFEDQALTRLQQPNLLLEGRGDPWKATADYGHVRKRPNPQGMLEEVVFLRQNVELSQTREPPRYLSMRSTSLYLYPDREYVETNESVTIDTHTGRTKASSMKGNLDTGVLRLKGDAKQVQTIVLPFQFK